MHINVLAVFFFLIAGSGYSNSFPSIAREDDPTSDPSPSFTTPRTTLQKRATIKKTGHIRRAIPQPLLGDINLKPMVRDEPVKEAQPSLEYLPPVVEAVNEAPGGYPRENPSNHVNLKPQAANVKVEVHAQVGVVQEKAGTGTSPRPLAVAPIHTQQLDSLNLSFLPPFEEGLDIMVIIPELPAEIPAPVALFSQPKRF